jgi:hypothetical protein
MVIELSYSTHESRFVNHISTSGTHMDVLHPVEHRDGGINGALLVMGGHAAESLKSLQCGFQQELFILGFVVAFDWDLWGQENVMKQVGHAVWCLGGCQSGSHRFRRFVGRLGRYDCE